MESKDLVVGWFMSNIFMKNLEELRFVTLVLMPVLSSKMHIEELKNTKERNKVKLTILKANQV